MRHLARHRLGKDAFIMLDPAVEILKGKVRQWTILCHTDLEVGMAVPPGEGLLGFVRSLMDKPIRVGTLLREFTDCQLVDEMLSSLLRHGFAHLTASEGPSEEALGKLRRKAYAMASRTLRRNVVVDLDAKASLDAHGAAWRAEKPAPELLLRCARLSDHRSTLAALARRRKSGDLRVHHVVVRTRHVRCDRSIRKSLVRLGATVEIEGGSWPAPESPIAGLAELTRDRVATHLIISPDASIFDEDVCKRTVEWVRKEFVCGLCLRLEIQAIWGNRRIKDAEFVGVFEKVLELESFIGDVVVKNLPSDEMLLGNAAGDRRQKKMSDAARRFRLAYLRWRLPLLKDLEGVNVWSQGPEAENQWIPINEDLVPNHPELLLLKPGSSVVDVCGGLGRVARRIAPAVGPGGTVVSVEIRRLLTERCRRFACELGVTNIEFRPGLAERLPLPDNTMDAAVNEWTGPIWELGLGAAMVNEMARVVRPGGRIAVSHRLVQLNLNALGEPWVQYQHIYQWVRDAFRHPGLAIIHERVWGHVVPSLGGEKKRLWIPQYLPRLADPDAGFFPDAGPDQPAPAANIYLTIIAERLP